MFIEEKYSQNVPTGPRNTAGMISQCMSIAGHVPAVAASASNLLQTIFLRGAPLEIGVFSLLLCALRITAHSFTLFMYVSLLLFFCVSVCGFWVPIQTAISKGALALRACVWNSELCGWILMSP
ncbi:hypothetical protein AVEN_267729-1 [Araneus ventricosus]|uniref:Uncharacterized protein n=1 Tax=Araneus ventricosus TaxID=182803 RepID=A0A4Y2CX98_ARAVE|nr:hypothetical protein AVEN_267729-1 [Araneus ventricosus]